MAAAASSLDVLNSIVPPPAKAPPQAVPTAVQPPAPKGPSSMDVLSGLAQGGNQDQQQVEPQEAPPEDTDFLSRVYQKSPIKGLVDTAKQQFDATREDYQRTQEVQKQGIELLKKGDYGRAAELLFSHLMGNGPSAAVSNLKSDPFGAKAGSEESGHADKAVAAGKKGDIGEAIVQGAESIPAIGPLAGNIGESLGSDLREGNYGGAAGDVVGGAAQIGSLLLGKKGAPKTGEPGIVRPGTTEVAGEKIPVRASSQEGAKGAVAKTAEYAADEKSLKKFDVEKTQPAVRKAASNVASEAADTAKAADVPAKEDAFGFGKASDELQARSKTVFKKLDDLSDREFSDAQEEAANARQDYTAAGRKAYKEALDKQESLFTKFQSQFEPGALDKAKADWKQSQGLEDLRVRFNRSVHPTPVELTKAGETDIGYVNGKSLRESITDALQKDKYGQNEFERAGFTPQHVQTIEDLGRLMEKGNNFHRINPIVKQLAVVASGGTAKVAELAGGKIMGKILTTPQAASTFLKGLKSGATAAAIANALKPYMKEEKEKQ